MMNPESPSAEKSSAIKNGDALRKDTAITKQATELNIAEGNPDDANTEGIP